MDNTNESTNDETRNSPIIYVGYFCLFIVILAIII